MRVETIGHIKELLEAQGLPYAFRTWRKELVYPYWIGDITEQAEIDERGSRKGSFFVTGTTKGSDLELIEVAERLELALRDYRTILPSGYGLAISYESARFIETGSNEFKRLEIILQWQEWRNR